MMAVFGHVEKMVFGERQAVAPHPVNLVEHVLIDSIPCTTVLLLQALYLDVLKAVRLRLVVTETLLSHTHSFPAMIFTRHASISSRLYR